MRKRMSTIAAGFLAAMAGTTSAQVFDVKAALKGARDGAGDMDTVAGRALAAEPAAFLQEETVKTALTAQELAAFKRLTGEALKNKSGILTAWGYGKTRHFVPVGRPLADGSFKLERYALGLNRDWPSGECWVSVSPDGALGPEITCRSVDGFGVSLPKLALESPAAQTVIREELSFWTGRAAARGS